MMIILMSQNSDKAGKISQQISEQAPPMIDKIIDKLTGTNASITYFFENFEIGIPNIRGPKGQQINGGKFTINGSNRISTELHNIKERKESEKDNARE
jgi:hypothetical protein